MKEKIILKSTHPESYPDLEVECRVIENDKIGEYLESIPEERKFIGYKKGMVTARKGIPGEVIKTVLKTVVDGKEYILNEEETIVKERTYSKKLLVAGNIEEYEVRDVDMVVTNIHSTSNEEYVVRYDKFISTYNFVADGIQVRRGFSPRWEPVYDPRILTQIDENVIIMTAWGSEAICLAGSYIVTYNAATNDYNTLEQGAFDSTYVREEQPKTKTIKKQ